MDLDKLIEKYPLLEGIFTILNDELANASDKYEMRETDPYTAGNYLAIYRLNRKINNYLKTIK